MELQEVKDEVIDELVHLNQGREGKHGCEMHCVGVSCRECPAERSQAVTIEDVRAEQLRRRSIPVKEAGNNVQGNKYVRKIKGVEVDVYDVLKAFEVTCPALQHAAKKVLCAGLRGHKDKMSDIREAKASLERAEQLNAE